jgi:hypothetical protein
MPVEGDATTQEAEDVFTTQLQTASTADGPGTIADTQGQAGPVMIEVAQTGTGTCTLTFEGSFDGITWYAMGYARVDNQAALTYAVAGIAVPAGPFNAVYTVRDPYTRMRGRQSATAGAVALTATLRGMPV